MPCCIFPETTVLPFSPLRQSRERCPRMKHARSSFVLSSTAVLTTLQQFSPSVSDAQLTSVSSAHACCSGKLVGFIQIQWHAALSHRKELPYGGGCRQPTYPNNGVWHWSTFGLYFLCPVLMERTGFDKEQKALDIRENQQMILHHHLYIICNTQYTMLLSTYYDAQHPISAQKNLIGKCMASCLQLGLVQK